MHNNGFRAAFLALAAAVAAGVGGGDALINVTTVSTLYGYIPIYNAYAVACTEVRGMAIRFRDGASAATPTAPVPVPAAKP